MGVNNMVQALQGGLENNFSIHRATLTPTSTCHCPKPDREEEDSTEEDRGFEKNSAEAQKIVDELYAMDMVVRYVGSGSQLVYLAQ